MFGKLPFPATLQLCRPLGYQLQSVEIRCQEWLLPNISESGWDQHPQLSVQHPFTYRMGRIGNKRAHLLIEYYECNGGVYTWGAGNATSYTPASLSIEERELTNALVESDTTAQGCGHTLVLCMRVAGTHSCYARPTIADEAHNMPTDAAHSMPKRAPHPRPRPPGMLSPICAQQHPLNPRTYPLECLAHGVPVIQYRST